MSNSDQPLGLGCSEGLGPVAWMRKRPDGTWTNEVLPNWQIEPVRKTSGAWVPLQEAPRWVPVSEALPPEHVTCAVRMQGDYIATAWAAYWHGARTDFARWVFPHDSDEECADKITHWLALPPLPAAGPNVADNRRR